MSDPEVTIIIPNYKTPELLKLCLLSLRKYTDPGKAKLIVVDNDSADVSTEYLRSLDWIRLIERKTDGESGPAMHAKALDLAMQSVDTPYVMIMHTDTIVIHPEWLDFLLDKVKAGPRIGGTGSWKLETVNPVKDFLKKIEEILRRLAGRKVKQEYRYFRSHCALYRTELVRKETNGFFDGSSAGLSLFRMLTEKGYEMPFIPSAELSKYLRHLNHATMILNPSSNDRKTTRASARARLLKAIEELERNESVQAERKH